MLAFCLLKAENIWQKKFENLFIHFLTIYIKLKPLTHNQVSVEVVNFN